MINDVVIVGKTKEISKVGGKCLLVVEVDRPFKEEDTTRVDSFKCLLWEGIFNRFISTLHVGDLVAIRGRIENHNESYYVVCERTVVLNKTRDNVLKNQ